jgi:hypothetical protein
MTTTADVERVILWAAIEDLPALWSLIDEVQALVPDRAQAAEQARTVTEQLVRDGALTVLTAPTVEGDTTPVEDQNEALRLMSDPRWWRTTNSYDEPVVRVDITAAGEQRYRSLVAASAGRSES